MSRCPWANTPQLIAYHDQEWGVPCHDDNRLFELLVLEGAQAGLSWSTVLAKRENYRAAFDDFVPERVARFSSSRIQKLVTNAGIIRHRAKIESAVSNAKAFLAVQREFGTFDRYVWAFVGGSPIQNRWKDIRSVPAATPQSEALSRDLKARDFKFVGPTICYAFMQAAGLVNDHLKTCPSGQNDRPAASVGEAARQKAPRR